MNNSYYRAKLALLVIVIVTFCIVGANNQQSERGKFLPLQNHDLVKEENGAKILYKEKDFQFMLSRCDIFGTENSKITENITKPKLSKELNKDRSIWDILKQEKTKNNPTEFSIKLFNNTIPRKCCNSKELNCESLIYLIKGEISYMNSQIKDIKTIKAGEFIIEKGTNHNQYNLIDNIEQTNGVQICIEYNTETNEKNSFNKLNSKIVDNWDNEGIIMKIVPDQFFYQIKRINDTNACSTLMDIEVKKDTCFGISISPGVNVIMIVLEGEVELQNIKNQSKIIKKDNIAIINISDINEYANIKGIKYSKVLLILLNDGINFEALNLEQNVYTDHQNLKAKNIKDPHNEIQFDYFKEENYLSQSQKYDSSNRRNIAGAFSATQSTVTGTGTATTVLVSSSLTVTVTAKDSSGTNIGTGGEKIWIRLQDQCNKSANNFYCESTLSSTFALSAAVWTQMTDNSDGTYTYTYTPTIPGKLTLFVYYFQASGFYSEFFLDSICANTYTVANISSTVNYLWASSGAMTTGCFMNCCSSYYALVKAPVTGTYTIKIDEAGDIKSNVDWVDFITEFGNAAYTETYSMTANQYYFFYIRYMYKSAATPYVKLYWTYPGQAEQIIPSSNTYYPQYVGSTPITITASCATGYSGTVTGHTGTCYPVCGDGLRVGTEKCDNGSTTGTGGCSSDCTSITAGWVCSGGSSTSADTCTQCGAGYYQNDATTPTTCVTHCGDGKRVGSEKCDNGSTTGTGGCSSDCTTITAGWVCSGGSSTTADTCTQCGAGFYQNDATTPTTCVPHCGDGLRVGTEKCDNGSTAGTGGCSSDCTSITAGWVCSGGSSTSADTCTQCGAGYYQNDATNPTTCVPHCGDGLRVGTEKCDNGSTTGTGGCSSDCTSITAGWVCSGGSSTSADTCTQCGAGYYQNDATTPTTCVTHCGDSKRVGSEKCDDGNTNPSDGCANDCTSVDSGWVCSGGSSSSADTCTQCATGYYQNDATNPTTCVTRCGDGLRVGSEKCDNGSTAGTGGCSSDCTSITAGWVCSGGSSTSADTCTQCGAGYYQNDATTPTTCVTHCGDSKRVGSEKCDDGNTNPSDGCANDCSSVDSGWVCSGGSSTSADTCTQCGTGYYQNDSTNPTTCVTHCGDSKRVGSEKCDDGNTNSNDGCPSDCLSVETDWICLGGSSSSADTCTKCAAGYHQNSASNPTTCVTVCGDSQKAGTEKCDDGNNSNGDGCKSDCSGVESGWVCSGGTTSSKDTCTKCGAGYYQNDSTNPTVCVTKCGDGLRVGSEKCDDGNSASGDGCSSDCSTVEASYVCNGGSSTSKDVCYICSGIYKSNSSQFKCIAASINTNSKILVSLLFLLIAIGIIFGILNAIFFGLFSYSFFSALNQLQLFIIVPLLGGVTANEILDFDRGITACLFSFYFIPVKSIFGSAIVDDQDISYLERIYIESNSSPANLVSVITVLIILAIAHLIVFLVNLCAKENYRNSKFLKILIKVLNSFKLGVYVIFLMECYVYFLLLCISEIERHKVTENTEIVSLTFAILLAIFCISMVAIACYEWMKSYNPAAYEKQKYFICLFFGLKNDWKFRSLGFLFLLRRTLLCITVLSIRFASFITKVGIFTGIQASYFLFMCIARPFARRHDNITECVIEFFNIVFPAFYFYFNSNSTWSSALAYFYISLLLINNFITAFIQFGIFASALYAKEKDRMRIRAEALDISYVNRRLTTKYQLKSVEETKQENFGISSDADPSSYLNNEIKGENYRKGPDDKSYTSRKTKPSFWESDMEVENIQDEMEVKKWNLKKLSFVPKTDRITEQRCGLHDNDPRYKERNKHKHHHDHHH